MILKYSNQIKFIAITFFFLLKSVKIGHREDKTKLILRLPINVATTVFVTVCTHVVHIILLIIIFLQKYWLFFNFT